MSERWSVDELATLDRVYRGATWPGVHNALPGRSKHAIRRIANERDIPRRIAAKPRWSGAALKVLDELYPRAAWTEMEARLEPHTRQAIAKVAQKRGLLRPQRGMRRKRRAIVDLLRARRKDKGWTQARLATRIGVHAKQVQTWEAGNAVPRLRKFLDWVDALDCELQLRPLT